ncbi:MAG: type 1 glutamine amidotransferase domain-containing protein [Armatimonadetes bacterium]|nr:type 1 glutamine amidotransferase domain-containing protein [Armatimonadota bacterium]
MRFLIALLLLSTPAWPDSPRILFVLTSHGQLGDTGRPTGFYLSEVTHPYEYLSGKGYAIDFVSPQGGEPPVDGVKLDDPINQKLYDDPVFRQKLKTTLRPDQVDPDQYAAIFFAGGHGTMWDLPGNEQLAAITRAIYLKDGVVAAVCHGPAGLLNVRLPDGSFMIAGQAVTGFSNSEERSVGLENVSLRLSVGSWTAGAGGRLPAGYFLNQVRYGSVAGCQRSNQG